MAIITQTEVRTASDIRNLPMRRYEDQGWTTSRRVSWSALWAGNFVAWATLLLLTLLGVGFATGTAWGTAAWFFFSVIASFYSGGMVAARLSGNPWRPVRVLHGVVTWALTTVEAFLLAGGFLAAVASGIAGVSTAGIPIPATAAAPASGERIYQALVSSVSSAAGMATISAWILFGLILVGFFAAYAGAYGGSVPNLAMDDR